MLLTSQVLHGLTFGVMQVAFVQTLRRHVAATLIAPAQGLAAALGTGGGTALMFALLGGCALLAVPLVVDRRRRERAAPTALRVRARTPPTAV